MKKLTKISVLLLILLSSFTPAFGSTSTHIVIGIDTSGSMEGAALQEAVSTANDLISQLGTAKELEIFTFARSITKLDDPQSLPLIRSSGYTSLYDAIWELSKVAKGMNASLIIITDGKDSRSALSVEKLLDLLEENDVAISIIAYQPKPEDELILREIAFNNSGGIYGVDDRDELIDTLAIVVDEIHNESVNINRTPAILIASAVGLLSLSLMQLGRRWRKKSLLIDTWSDLIDNYEIQGAPQSQVPKKLSALSERLRSLIGDTSLIFPSNTNPVQRQFLVFGSIVSIIALLVILGTHIIVALIIALVVAGIFLRLLVNREVKRMQEEFESELPGALKLIASSLTAGLSFLQALDTFSSEGKSQVAREFRRALSEIQMGAPIEQAFNDVAKRMDSADLTWVVFAFSVQREVGGSLAKILQTSAETIESRASLRQEVRTLSAEGRISSYILILLPPAIFAFLLMTRPRFISLFWEESIGHLMLATILLLMSLSWFWIRRLVRIET